MFDDKITNHPAGPKAPQNLPVGEPEDMFDSVEKEASTPFPRPTAEQPTAPAAVSALEAGALKRKQETIPAGGPPAAPFETLERNADTGPAAASEMYQIKEPTLTRGLIMTIIAVVALVIIGGGGWWIYIAFIAQPGGGPGSPDLFETAAPDSALPAPAPAPAPAAVADTESEIDLGSGIVDEQILFGEPIDTDGDGLDDDRERVLGTNPNHWDSDGDGLGDGDEVIIWKTDPLNPDSDGDGYLDGEEVKNGYNPAGQGRIFEPPVEVF